MLFPMTNVFRRAFGLWAGLAGKALEPVLWSVQRLKDALDRAARSASPAAREEGEPAAEIGPPAPLNDKERKVLGVLADAGRRHTGAMRLEELATSCFADVERDRANSWVRNSLRRLVRDGLVERADRGAYRATASGQQHA